MTADEYVESIVAKYAVPRGPSSPAERLGAAVAGPIRSWAGQQLNSLDFSGSYAKGTGVHGCADVDLFISLKADTTGTLKGIFDSLYSLAQKQGWAPREQNVSVGVAIGGTRGDLVTGRLQQGQQNYHSIYLRKRDSWTQTNVALHISRVQESGRLREIKAIKIWRAQRGLEFPSLYLELFVIRALSGRSGSSLADNVFHVLREIGSSLASVRVEDPSNTNNVVSDDLTLFEKQAIAASAVQTVAQPTWGTILW